MFSVVYILKQCQAYRKDVCISFYDIIPHSSPKYSIMYLPKQGHFVTLASYNSPNQEINTDITQSESRHMKFYQMSQHVSLSLLVQDPIQEHILYLVIRSLSTSI